MEKLTLVCLILMINIHLGQCQFIRMDSASLAQIESFIEDEKSAERMVGLSVGIIRDGEIVYLKGFGFEDSLNNILASENTMYRLASVSKSVTGLMAMKLIQNGDLDLNEDIRTYVPEYPEKAQGTITSEELLSNESGIIHYSGTGSGQYCSEAYDSEARDDYIDDHPNDYDPIAAIDIFKDQQICFTPGLHYQYTTWGFCLMGAVLERAADKPFEDILDEEIVCPLRLPSLQIEFQEGRPYAHQAAGYEFSGGDIIPTPVFYTDYQDVSYKVPGGGLISSVVDLTMLIQGVVNRDLLSDDYVKLFGTRHIADDNDATYYGYGTSTGSRNGDSLYWHSGSQAKTATIVYYSPENKNGLAIMSNTRGAYLFPLARLIYDYLPNVTVQGVEFQIPDPTLIRYQTTSYDTICEGESFEGFTETGIYSIKYTSALGCDSVAKTHLTVLPESDSYCDYLFTPEYRALGMRIHPNPATDQIVVEVFGKYNGGSLQAINALGQVALKTKILGDKIRIDIGALENGIYTLIYNVDSRVVSTSRLIVNH